MSRGVTLAGYAALAAAAAGYELAGRLRRRTPTLGAAVRLVSRWSAVRVVLAAAWLWLGWHVFVRVDWR